MNEMQLLTAHVTVPLTYLSGETQMLQRTCPLRNLQYDLPLVL